MQGDTPATSSFVIDTIAPDVAITGNRASKAFDGADTVAYTLTFTEGVQKIIAEDDLQVDGADIVSVLHEAGDTTATVTVKVDQDSLDNVSITAKPSILDVAGNPMDAAVSNASQTVDTRNPSTIDTAPVVSDAKITDADANGADGPSTLSVSFTFNEAMDTDTDPTVSFAPEVQSTLTNPGGAWLDDGKTYKFEATVADAGVDVDEVRIDITGAKDAAGNLQADHTASVGLEIDTLNPSVTITGNRASKAFDGADTVAYTLTFTEGVQKIIAEDDLQVDGADIVSVLHEAGDTTATVTVKVDQDSLDNVSITAKTSITDIAGNALVEAVVNNSQEVDTTNPSTIDTAPVVSDAKITDADANGADGPSTLSVSFTFNEAMDTDTDPTVSFAPDVQSTLTNPGCLAGRWQDLQIRGNCC